MSRLRDILNAYEKKVVNDTLDAFDRNVLRSARYLGVSGQALRYLCKKHNLHTQSRSDWHAARRNELASLPETELGACRGHFDPSVLDYEDEE